MARTACRMCGKTCYPHAPHGYCYVCLSRFGAATQIALLVLDFNPRLTCEDLQRFLGIESTSLARCLWDAVHRLMDREDEQAMSTYATTPVPAWRANLIGRYLLRAVDIAWQSFAHGNASAMHWNSLPVGEAWEGLYTALSRSYEPEAEKLLKWFLENYHEVYAVFAARWQAGEYRRAVP